MHFSDLIAATSRALRCLFQNGGGGLREFWNDIYLLDSLSFRRNGLFKMPAGVLHGRMQFGKVWGILLPTGIGFYRDDEFIFDLGNFKF